MLAESLPNPPAVLSLNLRWIQNAFLPYHFIDTRNFGIVLEPRYIVGTGRLDQ